MKSSGHQPSVLGLLTEVGILLIGDNEDPLAINLGPLMAAVQIDFSINLYLALRAVCFQASSLFFLSVPLWTHQLVYESRSVRQWQLPFQEFRAASFEIYSLPVQLRIQFWTLVRGRINMCWTMKDRLVINVWMCV